ncbi:hypothetical protein L7F22_026148 [Adiantum nelumboides]|nr:hypothetical protein [Adiantum nelumboides]
MLPVPHGNRSPLKLLQDQGFPFSGPMGIGSFRNPIPSMLHAGGGRGLRYTNRGSGTYQHNGTSENLINSHGLDWGFSTPGDNTDLHHQKELPHRTPGSPSGLHEESNRESQHKTNQDTSEQEDEENKIEDEGDMSQATQQVLPTIDEDTPFHKGDAMSTQEVVEHESDFVAQKPSNDLNKGSENMLPTIGETQIHEGNTRNSEEKMVVVENQSDVQTSPKPSDDMIIKDTYNMPLRDEEVEGSEKKDEANEEHQGALATTEVQDKVDKGTGKCTRNANKAQSIQGRVQGTEGGEKNKGVVEIHNHGSNVPRVDIHVVFYPTRSNPRWWYVIQIAPRSRHIFDKGGVEEDLPEHAMEEEDEANNFTSGHLHTAMSDLETSMSREENSSDDSSDESGDHESDGNNDDPFNSIDKDDTATMNSVTSTSLGINLEIHLEITHEDMLLDEVSTPLDG